MGLEWSVQTAVESLALGRDTVCVLQSVTCTGCAYRLLQTACGSGNSTSDSDYHACNQPLSNPAHVWQQVIRPWWVWEDALLRSRNVQLPGWALVHVKLMEPVLVPCPLAVLGHNRVQQPIVQHTGDTCRGPDQHIR